MACRVPITADCSPWLFLEEIGLLPAALEVLGCQYLDWGHGVVGEASLAVPVSSRYQVTLGWWLPMHSISLTSTDKLFSSHIWGNGNQLPLSPCVYWVLWESSADIPCLSLFLLEDTLLMNIQMLCCFIFIQTPLPFFLLYLWVTLWLS